MRCAPTRLPVTGQLDLVLDLPIDLHARHNRVHRRILLRGFRGRIDAIEHRAQLRVQLGALLGDPGVLTFGPLRLVNELRFFRAFTHQLHPFDRGDFQVGGGGLGFREDLAVLDAGFVQRRQLYDDAA
ncbi:hypothetical protein [Mycolicibacterium peregrinum]|uniref:hypothetical protein n=1 Tax=Mycolicibacterium peregrinum TaxID=43304 RepID=UPI003AAB21C7